MENHQQTFEKWRESGPRFPWRQLIMGVLAPITIFYVLHRCGRPLTGALLAIGWSIGLLIIKYLRARRVELFPALAIPIIVIELVEGHCFNRFAAQAAPGSLSGCSHCIGTPRVGIDAHPQLPFPGVALGAGKR